MKLKKLEDLTEPELRDLMSTLASITEHILTLAVEGTPLFTILVFNDPKVGQYVSNCERLSIIEALRETADRLERNEDVPRN